MKNILNLMDCEEFQEKQIGFVVPQTSLRKTMKLIFKSIYGLRPSQVLSPSDITKIMTRGIQGTFLYVCDDDLRDYLSQYIEVEN